MSNEEYDTVLSPINFRDVVLRSILEEKLEINKNGFKERQKRSTINTIFNMTNVKSSNMLTNDTLGRYVENLYEVCKTTIPDRAESIKNQANSELAEYRLRILLPKSEREILN